MRILKFVHLVDDAVPVTGAQARMQSLVGIHEGL